jgi:hypothetical protein
VNPRVGSWTPVDSTGTSLAATSAVRPPLCAQSSTAMNRPMAAASRTPPAAGLAALRPAPTAASSAHEVVQRAEEEHRIDRRIRLREPAGVADFGGQQPVLSCGSDTLRDDVDQMHAVAPASQPGRVYAGAAAHVEHPGRRRWQLPLLARAQQREAVMAKPEKALPLVLPRIVRE